MCCKTYYFANFKIPSNKDLCTRANKSQCKRLHNTLLILSGMTHSKSPVIGSTNCWETQGCQTSCKLLQLTYSSIEISSGYECSTYLVVYKCLSCLLQFSLSSMMSSLTGKTGSQPGNFGVTRKKLCQHDAFSKKNKK